MKDIKINHLPVPTWNWLKINDKTISIPDNCIVPKNETSNDKKTITSAEFKSFDKDNYTLLNNLKYSGNPELKNYINASANGGVLYKATKGDNVAEPVRITYDLDGNAEGYSDTLNFVLEENSILKAVIIYKGNPKFFATNINVKTEKNSVFSLVTIFDSNEDSNIYSNIDAFGEENSSFNLYQISCGRGNVGLSVCSDLQGEFSNINIDSNYLVKGNDNLDINYVVKHEGAKSDSKIFVTGTLFDEAVKTFRGTIDFIKGSKTATGEEREDVLLLDEGVTNNTIPLILCAEEDVEGAHGASIGQISDEAIHYFKTRGVNADKINDIMARERLNSAFARIPDEKTRNLYIKEEE